MSSWKHGGVVWNEHSCTIEHICENAKLDAKASLSVKIINDASFFGGKTVFEIERFYADIDNGQDKPCTCGCALHRPPKLGNGDELGRVLWTKVSSPIFLHWPQSYH